MVRQQTGQHVEKGPTSASCGEKRDCPLGTFPHIPLGIVHVVSEFWKVQKFSHHTGARNVWLSVLWGLAKFVSSQVALLFSMHGNLHRLPYSVVTTWFAGWFRESRFLLVFVCSFPFSSWKYLFLHAGTVSVIGSSTGHGGEGKPSFHNQGLSKSAYISVHAHIHIFFFLEITLQNKYWSDIWNYIWTTTQISSSWHPERINTFSYRQIYQRQ